MWPTPWRASYPKLRTHCWPRSCIHTGCPLWVRAASWFRNLHISEKVQHDPHSLYVSFGSYLPVVLMRVVLQTRPTRGSESRSTPLSSRVCQRQTGRPWMLCSNICTGIHTHTHTHTHTNTCTLQTADTCTALYEWGHFKVEVGVRIRFIIPEEKSKCSTSRTAHVEPKLHLYI